MNKRKAHVISNGIFLVCLGLLILTGFWWPGILLALWISISSRQYLTGHPYYAAFTSFIFCSLFFVALFKFDFAILAPVLLVIAGVSMILKEYFSAAEKVEIQEEPPITIEDDGRQ